MNKKNENCDVLDVAKFGLAMVVVSLHSKILPHVAIPLQRIAVPLFFMISSYLFFTKEKLLPSLSESVVHVREFIIRTAKLYLFWFVALLPMTVYLRREWFFDGFFIGLSRFVFNIPFGSTFVASWFIPALAIGVLLVWWMGRRISFWGQFAVAVLFYALATVASSYGFMCPFDIGFFGDWWKPYNSFPVAVFWVLCGKCVAEHSPGRGRAKGMLAMMVALSVAVLYLEWKWIGLHGGKWDCDAYFFLFPAVLWVFLLMLEFRVSVPCAKLLRKLSVMIYAVHGTLVYAFFFLVKTLGYDYIQHTVLCFFVVSAVSIALGGLVLKLETKVRCLSNAH